ncbi:MAG TPA: sigma factor-like helix-turn-helix DNA-binding protein, partial [Caulobacter sp.]|nr:sigma factor-like helix-turn-helix DNA-binding protein [Caulobacter sp.]
MPQPGRLDQTARESGGRIIAALAAAFRDLDLAEEAYAEACARAAAVWPSRPPHDPAAWLYATARRAALDAVRRRGVRGRLAPDPPQPPPSVEEAMTSDDALIPDERLRLIFVCCHPVVPVEARAPLTLRLVCGLSVREIARAFLVAEPAMFQRLTRAKRRIAQSGEPFEIPGPQAWTERLSAVLSTLEVAYAKAHEDAAGAGAHAGYARDMLALTGALAELLPNEPECLGLAALVRHAEARRPARLDETGAMVPLSEQDPTLWRKPLMREAERLLRRAAELDRLGPRQLQAAIHAVWCGRKSLAEPPRWAAVLRLYDALLDWRDDAVVRLNRAVALAEVAGPQAALTEVEG